MISVYTHALERSHEAIRKVRVASADWLKSRLSTA